MPVDFSLYLDAVRFAAAVLVVISHFVQYAIIPAPAAAYVPFVQTGKLVFLSGHIARKDGTPWVGQFGKTMSTAEGQAAARSVAIDLMGTLQAACQAAGGDLNSVKRIVKVMSLVNSTADFT